MTEPTTIRECLESLKALGESGKLSHSTLIAVERKAQAALALLDNAARRHDPHNKGADEMRLVPDPAPPKETDAPTAT